MGFAVVLLLVALATQIILGTYQTHEMAPFYVLLVANRTVEF